MNLVLIDSPQVFEHLKPFTFTRPISKLRIGILTIAEKWEKRLGLKASFLTNETLKDKYKIHQEDENTFVFSHFMPTNEMAAEIKALKQGEKLVQGTHIIAISLKKGEDVNSNSLEKAKTKNYTGELIVISQLPDLFLQNGPQIIEDYDLVTKGRRSQKITDKGSIVYNEERVFVEEGVSIRACTINAENGPVYIGKNAILQENSLIIGPACIGDNAMVAYGAKIRYNTTLGPFSRVGGEVGNTIFLGYSNKAHDGFLGNSVIGEWCNLGANTNNSNLKNNYKSVSLYNYAQGAIVDTGELFCGTFMGDYTKTGISTMLNTGTVIGVCSNIFGANFQEKFVPSFSWGGKEDGYEIYKFEKAVEVINATMDRRGMALNKIDLDILKAVFEQRKLRII